MKLHTIDRVLGMLLILSALAFMAPWGGFPTTPRAHASNLQSPHTLVVETRFSIFG